MSWEQLGAIMAEAAQLAADEAVAVPLACPRDGEPLQESVNGTRFCPFCGLEPAAGFSG